MPRTIKCAACGQNIAIYNSTDARLTETAPLCLMCRKTKEKIQYRIAEIKSEKEKKEIV